MTKNITNTMQLLVDTEINAFAAKLLAESFDEIDSKVKSSLPNPLVFSLGNCEITLRDISSTCNHPGKSDSSK